MKLLKLLAQAATMAAPSAPLPAASMGGEHFYNAAKAAGLEPDVETLNEIVDLVNKGLTPQGAAQQVKARKGASNGLLAPKKAVNPGARAGGLLSAPAGGLLSMEGIHFPPEPSFEHLSKYSKQA